VAYFFRDPGAMDAVDRAALSHARGRVLDVGACAGAHAVPLAGSGHPVTALDLIPEAVAILGERGVEDARLESVWTFRPPASYDTVLALMNGTGLAGTSGRLASLLEALATFVAPGGQLLIDSTELEPDDGLEEAGAGEALEARPPAVELHYQLEFEGVRGPPFPQLFVSEAGLGEAAARTGWSMEVVAREGERYLALLTPAAPAP
jgi:hypothetical protein